jgi:DNA-binding PadR family transcriptional regulator
MFRGLFARRREEKAARWGGRRFFDHGALRLVVLGLVGEEPRHGYDIIRLMKERFQGAYSPSPGSIYPILAQLAEAGLMQAETQGQRKLFTLTEAGKAYLEAQRPEFEAIKAQLDETADPIGSSSLGEAIAAFRGAVFAKIRGGALSPAQARRLSEILARAQKEIESL